VVRAGLGYNLGVRVVVACALVAGCGTSKATHEPAEPALGTSHAQPQLVSRHPAPWSRDRIDQELRRDPSAALRELARGPFVFSDIDAGTDEIVCTRARASEAIDKVAAILATAPIATCSKDPQDATTGAIVCLRAQPGSPVVIATFTRDSGWVLSALQIEQLFDSAKVKTAAVTAQEMIAKGLVCP
jgi:hypothetical protein